ncbi:hypothetical protein DKX38_024649 [Salix brachista]|uniref:Rab5-interacting protein n=1 Tax=Salix brachista TaxID=2182728 RepID=A0A5N5JS93_9ROSI|nr:hypothetical protein DKX38_024649 [Salix brachista]
MQTASIADADSNPSSSSFFSSAATDNSNSQKSSFVVVSEKKSSRVAAAMKEGKFSAKLNNSNNQQHQNGHLSPFKLAKLLDPEASWDKVLLSLSLPLSIQTLDQLGDVLHWIRQFVALVCGLLWGAIPLVGGIWIGLFLLISSGIIYVYYAMILKIDEDDFGGHGTLLQEGLFASITLFLLSWILMYSLAHF